MGKEGETVVIDIRNCFVELCDNRHRWWRVKIFKRLWMTWWQPQTTPIFITIRVTTTGNENLEPCGSGYKKQILYLTEGGGRIPLRLVHELSRGWYLITYTSYCCNGLPVSYWSDQNETASYLFNILYFFKSIKITCKNFSLKIRFYIAKEKNNQRENIFGIN